MSHDIESTASSAKTGGVTESDTSMRGSTRVALRLEVNGSDWLLPLENHLTLLDALRDHLGLVGTKKGCDQGAAAPARCTSTASLCCRA